MVYDWKNDFSIDAILKSKCDKTKDKFYVKSCKKSNTHLHDYLDFRLENSPDKNVNPRLLIKS